MEPAFLSTIVLQTGGSVGAQIRYAINLLFIDKRRPDDYQMAVEDEHRTSKAIRRNEQAFGQPANDALGSRKYAHM